MKIADSHFVFYFHLRLSSLLHMQGKKMLYNNVENYDKLRVREIRSKQSVSETEKETETERGGEEGGDGKTT